MKQQGKRILLILLAVVLLASAAGCLQTQSVLPGDLVKHVYRMDLTLNEADKTLTGDVRVQYRNASGQTLQEIPFLVYPNAFLSEATAPFDPKSMPQAYPNGFSAGGLSITGLCVDGADAAYTLANEDSTLLTLRLPQPLAPDAVADISIGFAVRRCPTAWAVSDMAAGR